MKIVFSPASRCLQNCYTGPPLEQYPLHSSSLTSSTYIQVDDDDLSPLTFSPPTLVPLDLLSPSEPGQPSAFKRSFTYNSPFQLPHHSFFDFDPSVLVPCSPSRRPSATLPALEPSTFDTNLFRLHNSVPESPPLHHANMDVPKICWCSFKFPGCETDDDLIPVELASKKYIPDPSIIVPTISTGKSSLILWDNDLDDCSNIPRTLPGILHLQRNFISIQLFWQSAAMRSCGRFTN